MLMRSNVVLGRGIGAVSTCAPQGSAWGRGARGQRGRGRAWGWGGTPGAHRTATRLAGQRRRWSLPCPWATHACRARSRTRLRERAAATATTQRLHGVRGDGSDCGNDGGRSSSADPVCQERTATLNLDLNLNLLPPPSRPPARPPTRHPSIPLHSLHSRPPGAVRPGTVFPTHHGCMLRAAGWGLVPPNIYHAAQLAPVELSGNEPVRVVYTGQERAN